ncbi:MAG: permease [Gammaproteobacteria bacterium (ex Lamellibrachia satsuma)]|nr:MAG: SO_0444 family Cu/Zn efflux transporter [Gammaproteobacteria bacterium (ex Lamellibrachia satsuma)]RRS31787.1 MAG: permease [Gammaproteobacteria bacterium (ex Lamellibrachia satsuma)]RRS33687.1 MAG: permease [Gammaproteobacteria bacterium (ex Lamellibrachia satsuma)]
MDFLTNLADLYLDAAPWLLLGLIAAGLIKAWLPEDRLNQWLGGEGLWPVIKAALIGAPLPLCSCGVLPAALGIRRAGASKGVTLSFMIATPETGPDSIAVSYALLGPFMAVVRPIAAVLSAVFTGLLATKEQMKPLPLVVACNEGTCCENGCQTEVKDFPPDPLNKSLRGLRYAFNDILDDLVLWLGLGLVLAALVATLVPPLMMAEWGSGLSAKLLMLLVGIPMYVCATASTPIAAGLLLAGISPGTVLVFLLAGPATNIATIAVITREMGKMTTVAYLSGISLSSVLLGLVTDYLVTIFDIDIMAQLDMSGESLPGWVALISGALLLIMAIKPLRQSLGIIRK